MNVLEFTLLLFGVSLCAGFLGALTGLGGGVVLVPAMTLLFGVNMRYAIGASLVSVIATSSGAAAAYVKEGFSNIRIGMFLEIATCIGAVLGAALAGVLSTAVIAAIFGIVLLYSAWSSLHHPEAASGDLHENDLNISQRLKLSGAFPTRQGQEVYHSRRAPLGFVVMAVAGALSGLLGIGSGAVKVIAMDQVMGLPFKVSTTTSNFMIGVTAAASAGLYLSRGYIDPGLAMPVMLGALAGSLLGARHLIRSNVEILRKLFAGAIALMAIEMLVNVVSGGA